jgi:hypothetical protein
LQRYNTLITKSVTKKPSRRMAFYLASTVCYLNWSSPSRPFIFGVLGGRERPDAVGRAEDWKARIKDSNSSAHWALAGCDPTPYKHRIYWFAAVLNISQMASTAFSWRDILCSI